jgi:predicted deacetylase
MSKYILRLDDASPYRDIDKWERMEKLLLKYKILPLVGIIPNNKDKKFTNYPKDEMFWDKVNKWLSYDWEFALHGYDHVYSSYCGGMNPINKESEFAGVPLEEQEKKIINGIEVFKEQGISPKVFFAPSHTFDENTLLALKKNSNIRIISDTIANDIYFQDDFFFVPQQSGSVRKLPFRTVTFCYHPDVMCDADFLHLEEFLKNNKNKFVSISSLDYKERKKSVFDRMLSFAYLNLRTIYRKI